MNIIYLYNTICNVRDAPVNDFFIFEYVLLQRSIVSVVLYPCMSIFIFTKVRRAKLAVVIMLSFAQVHVLREDQQKS